MKKDFDFSWLTENSERLSMLEPDDSMATGKPGKPTKNWFRLWLSEIGRFFGSPG